MGSDRPLTDELLNEFTATAYGKSYDALGHPPLPLGKMDSPDVNPTLNEMAKILHIVSPEDLVAIDEIRYGKNFCHNGKFCMSISYEGCTTDIKILGEFVTDNDTWTYRAITEGEVDNMDYDT